MDASVFCFVARELAPRIRGMRVEKVFAPLPEAWTISLGRAGHLVLCTARPTPFLYLADHKPENPQSPSGRAMWLRKRLKGRRILDLVSDWPRRRLALDLSAGEGRWLILDLEAAPLLADALPPGFGDAPQWPELERIMDEEGLWRTQPHLTPPLRHYLRSVSRVQAQDMVDSLKDGTASTFYYGLDQRGRSQVRLWPLQDGGSCVSALEAAQKAHGQTLAEIERAHTGADRAVARNIRRIERALERVGQDHKRLQGMIDKQSEALLLQANLHSLDKNARMAMLRLPGEQGEEAQVRLDPGLTVRENMERFFVRATKGDRGLAIVAARVRALRQELETARQGMAPDEAVRSAATSRAATVAAPVVLPAKLRKIKVQAYRSSDGFLIVRGRSAQANHQLLTQAASPFDYWLHAQDGPGAHVIIKRDFPAQEVPEGTIQEAAALAALASHLKMADRGEVILCLVKDVRPIKGAALGMVGVDKVLRTVRPAIDPALEDKLRFQADR
jgi:predicted ribosome quality control (RQC) complex YloA/Tae2 family protein